MAQKPKGPGGRPSEFSEAVADEICRLIAEDGLSVRAVCKRDEMPARSVVFKWLSQQPQFADQYARAMEERANAIFEEVIEQADECPPDKDAAAAYRLRIDARKWAAGKLNPKRYGDRQQIDVSGNIRTLSDEQIDSRLSQLLGKAGLGPALGGTGEEEEGEQA